MKDCFKSKSHRCSCPGPGMIGISTHFYGDEGCIYEILDAEIDFLPYHKEENPNCDMAMINGTKVCTHNMKVLGFTELECGCWRSVRSLTERSNKMVEYGAKGKSSLIFTIGALMSDLFIVILLLSALYLLVRGAYEGYESMSKFLNR